MASEEKRIEDELSYPILLAERVRATVDEAQSFKLECSEVWKQVDRLLQMLRTLVRFATTTPSLYERPIRRVAADLSKNLERALTLVRKCKRQSILRRVVNIVGAADFRKVMNYLEASVGDMKWLLSIFDTDGAGGGGIVLSLPPIASNDPILSWVWSFISSIQMGQLNDRIEAANELAALAQDNDRNKKIIVEEGGVSPLLKLFKETSSPTAQIAAATALCHLANDLERVRMIVNELGVPIVVQVLGDSPIRVQIQAANLVARMAEHDPVAQEDFARENAIRPLVTLLSFDTFDDDHTGQLGKQSIHSIIQINKELEKKSLTSRSSNRPFANSYSNSYLHVEGSSRAGNHRKERENEDPMVKLQLKITCAEALWMLAKASVSNSKKITETKGMLCLAKLVEKEQGELQYNCLMTIMEITAAAESNADLRRAAFKTNSPAAKAVVEQLLRVIKELDSPTLQIPAIKSIGSLARTFPARETRVIGPLVTQLGHRNPSVATEAAIALCKFACPENFLCVEHSKAIIDFNGVPALMRLLRGNEDSQLHGLILLCYLALHAGNSESLEHARVLTTLEGADRTFSQHPELRELVPRAIVHLNLYHAGSHSQRMSYYP
ncbi:ARM REPEAT PROTEIN INTERACTING WITH ABF2 isoform X1 [Senna tora]|uniref:ARM REPEAT PROTEIN INTERACTING WITH ABF2 isoform X1 n=1 Tax=Senna tora TaxID=362788 RepID=A0A834SSU6_9FABA|nr:ARM REPEAT PROTEIN INTERACTING WITH ABF2 isoform X1 [Senna tora]